MLETLLMRRATDRHDVNLSPVQNRRSVDRCDTNSLKGAVDADDG